MKTTKPISQWTKEECISFVKKNDIIKKTDLLKKYPGVYVRMKELGCRDEYFGTYKYAKMSKDECFAEVKRLGCKNATELSKKCASIWNKMNKMGWMGEYFGTRPIVTKWTKEECFEAIRKEGYKTRNELSVMWGALSKKMKKEGWMDEFFGSDNGYAARHTDPISEWSKERCFTSIKERGYKSPNELIIDWPGMHKKLSKEGWIKDYPWESYKERTILNPIFRPLLENVPRAITMPSAIYLYMVEAVGDKTLAGRLLKKIAKTDADTGDRKAIVELLKEKQNEAVDDKEIQKVADETPDSDTKIKENDEPTIEEKEEVDVSKEMAEKQLVNIKAQGEFINQVMKSPKMYNIFNSGDTLKSMLTFMQNELMRLVCAGHKDMVEKFIAENK